VNQSRKIIHGLLRKRIILWERGSNPEARHKAGNWKYLPASKDTYIPWGSPKKGWPKDVSEREEESEGGGRRARGT